MVHSEELKMARDLAEKHTNLLNDIDCNVYRNDCEDVSISSITDDC